MKPAKKKDKRFKEVTKSIVHNVLLRPDVNELLPLIAAKLHLKKKNIKGKVDYSRNEIHQECILYTARMLEVNLTRPTIHKEKAHGKGSTS